MKTGELEGPAKRVEWQVHLKSPVIALAQHMAQAPVCCLQTQPMGTKILLITMAHIFFYQIIPEVKHITLELSYNFPLVLERSGKSQMGERLKVST